MHKVYSRALVLNVKHDFKLHSFFLTEETDNLKKLPSEVQYQLQVVKTF